MSLDALPRQCRGFWFRPRCALHVRAGPRFLKVRKRDRAAEDLLPTSVFFELDVCRRTCRLVPSTHALLCPCPRVDWISKIFFGGGALLFELRGRKFRLRTSLWGLFRSKLWNFRFHLALCFSH